MDKKFFIIFISTSLSLLTFFKSYSKINDPTSDEIDIKLLEWTPLSWVKEVIEDDSKKTLQKMKLEVDSWIEFESFVDEWNIEFTEMYQGPTEQERRKFLTKQFFKFADQKLSDHLKSKDEKNPAAIAAGKVREAANPKVDFSFISLLKLKFRAKPLLGEAYLFLENPFVEWRAEFYSSGPIKIVIGKDLGLFWGLKTEVDYQVKEQTLTTSFKANIYDFIEGRISNSQKFGALQNEPSYENKIELLYTKKL